MIARKLIRLLLTLGLALVTLISVSQLAAPHTHADGTAYYVNNQVSYCNDNGTGQSQTAPWCTFNPVNNHTFGPGDQLLLARGATWDQQLTLNGSGSSSAYITLDAYSTGANPKIIRDGNASDRAIRMTNLSYWNVGDLEVGNAGTGILVYYTGVGYQGLNFYNIYAHDIRGIHHQGDENNTGCVFNQNPTNDYIWNSSGLEFTGAVTSIPSGQYVLQNVQISNITGRHNEDSVSIDWCNGANGNAANVVIKGLNLQNDDGPAEGCDDGMRLTATTNLVMMDSLLNNEGACYSRTGTAAIFTGILNNATIVNNIIENTPNTGSPDQTGVDYEAINNQTRLRDDYIAGNAGAGMEELTIYGANSESTNSEISGNTFVNNSVSLLHVGTDAVPTGSATNNLYSEPGGFTGGDFSGFSPQPSDPAANNLSIASASNIYNAGAGFSNTQGQNGWSYEYSNDGSTWNNLPYNSTTGLWQDTTKPGGVPWIGQFDQHPDVCSSCWVGRTWTASQNGTVSVRGRVLKSDTGGGDGVIARVTKNGSVIWGPQTIASNDTNGLATDLDNITVNTGDVIRFEIANNANNTHDATSWVPAVAYTSTSSTSTTLNRYFNGSIPDHWVTTGTVTSGYQLEGPLGYLLPSAQTGTQALYGCQDGTDHFVSVTSNCEGYTVLRTEGWIYSSQPSGIATTALYRCNIGPDHFVSGDPNCEGQTVEFLLGYAKTNP